MEQSKKSLVFAIFGMIVLGGFIIGINIYNSNNVVQEVPREQQGASSGDIKSSNGSNGNVAFDGVLGLQRERAQAQDEMVSSDDMAEGDESSERDVIRTGSISMRVSNVDEAAQEVQQIAQENEGFVSGSTIYEAERGSKRGEITVRVPAQRFGQIFEQIKSVATVVLNESTYAQDVTEQTQDIEARLGNKRQEEEAFLALLDNEELTQSPENIITLTREISRVRGEIERLEAAQQQLEEQVSFASITIYIQEDVRVASTNNQWRPGQVAQEAFAAFLGDLRNTTDNVIVFLIRFIPIITIYVLALVILYFISKFLFLRFWKTEKKDIKDK
jgi:hypothetical protein